MLLALCLNSSSQNTNLKHSSRGGQAESAAAVVVAQSRAGLLSWCPAGEEGGAAAPAPAEPRGWDRSSRQGPLSSCRALGQPGGRWQPEALPGKQSVGRSCARERNYLCSCRVCETEPRLTFSSWCYTRYYRIWQQINVTVQHASAPASPACRAEQERSWMREGYKLALVLWNILSLIAGFLPSTSSQPRILSKELI